MPRAPVTDREFGFDDEEFEGFETDPRTGILVDPDGFFVTTQIDGIDYWVKPKGKGAKGNFFMPIPHGVAPQMHAPATRGLAATAAKATSMKKAKAQKRIIEQADRRKRSVGRKR